MMSLMRLKFGSIKNYLIILSAFLTLIWLTGCAETRIETRIEYIKPSIPQSVLEPCKAVDIMFETNGELLMSLIELQTSYLECSSKVYSISQILNSYDSIYSSISEDTD